MNDGSAAGISKTLARLRRGVNALFMLWGTSLTVYIGVSVAGFISNSQIYYSTFVFATIVMAVLYMFQQLLDEKLAGEVKRFWHVRMLGALVTAVLSIAGSLYIRINTIRLEFVNTFFEPIDMQFGVVMLVGLLLLNWYHWGWLLTSLIGVTILYFFYGYMVPHPLLMLPQYDATFVMHYMGLGVSEGMFWFARLAADAIYFLVIFAAILIGVGMLKMVLEVGKAAGNRVRGGAAFPAIIGSGVVASVMGQAVANVVLTGRLTIPMMIQRGFRKNMAGAVEAVASTSGQIMPPVLGLAGFIIAVFLNLPYIEVAMAGLIPALLFLTGVMSGVIIGAYRESLPKLSEEVEIEAIKRLVGPFLISFSAVIYLLVGYYSPAIAGLAGIILALALAPFQGKYRPTARQLYKAYEDGLVIVTLLSVLLIAIGPLAQTFQTTNLASRIGVLVLQILPDSKILLLMGAMVVSLLLGMGLPTPVAYVVVALSLVPFMLNIGVEPLMAHFFVFYFAVFSTITPPVAVSALAASKLSGGTFLGTTLDAMKLMLTTFIIPFGFVYHPVLLAFPKTSWAMVPPIALLLALQWTTSFFCYGYCFRDLNALERFGFGIVTFAGLVALVHTGTMEIAAFLVLLVAAIGWCWTTRGRLVEPQAAE